MDHPLDCAIHRTEACDCLAGRQVRALEEIARHLDYLTDHLSDIGRGLE